MADHKLCPMPLGKQTRLQPHHRRPQAVGYTAYFSDWPGSGQSLSEWHFGEEKKVGLATWQSGYTTPLPRLQKHTSVACRGVMLLPEGVDRQGY